MAQVVIVIVLASHRCGPSSNPGVDVMCGLSLLLVLFFALRGFSPGTPVFPLLKSQKFHELQIPIRLGIRPDKQPFCGCVTSKSLFIYLFFYYFKI